MKWLSWKMTLETGGPSETVLVQSALVLEMKEKLEHGNGKWHSVLRLLSFVT